MFQIVLVQGFCPLKIRITLFPGGSILKPRNCTSMCDIKHLMTAWSWGKQLILFPENLDSRKTKFTVSWGTSLKVICYIAGNFEGGNSLNLAVTAVMGQHSEVTVHYRPLVSINFACCEILAGNSFIVKSDVSSK